MNYKERMRIQEEQRKKDNRKTARIYRLPTSPVSTKVSRILQLVEDLNEKMAGEEDK